MNNLHPILVIIGPSGSGKSTAIQKLADAGVVIVNPTWTTRPPRDEEEAVASIEHVFVDENEFATKMKEGFFIKTGKLFGHWFGFGVLHKTTKQHVSTVVLRASLVREFRKAYPKAIVYQITDSRDRIERRIAERKSEVESQKMRLDEYEEEMRLGRKIADRTFVNNKDINDLVAQVGAAIAHDFYR